MITFNRIGDEYGWMSETSNHSIEYDGLEFKKALQLFVYLRFKDLTEEDIDLILESTNTKKLKSLTSNLIEAGKKLKHKLYSQSDLDLMRLVTSLKVEQNAELKEELLKTGEQVIIKDVSTRAKLSDDSLFWGGMLVEGDETSEEYWNGRNELGEIWMNLRAEYSGVNKVQEAKSEPVKPKTKPKQVFLDLQSERVRNNVIMSSFNKKFK